MTNHHLFNLMLFVTMIVSMLLASGCIAIPIGPSHNVENMEEHINKLIDKSTNRSEVTKEFGTPTRQYETEASYKICSGGNRFFIIAGGGFSGYAGIYDNKRIVDCFEVVLHFDTEDYLISYEKHALESYSSVDYRVPNGDARPILLRMAEKGFTESQWRLYDEYGRKPDDIIWLCRSADNGYAKAQIYVGHLYLLDSNIPDHKVRAYVWYKLAATGDMLQGLSPDIPAQNTAETLMHDVEKELKPEQKTEAKTLYADWHPGQCEKDLAPEFSGN